MTGPQLSTLEEISYTISTAPPLPGGALPCPSQGREEGAGYEKAKKASASDRREALGPA